MSFRPLLSSNSSSCKIFIYIGLAWGIILYYIVLYYIILYRIILNAIRVGCMLGNLDLVY